MYKQWNEKSTMYEACVSETHYRMLMGESTATVRNTAGNIRVMQHRGMFVKSLLPLKNIKYYTYSKCVSAFLLQLSDT
jgi:hypothetical protein